MKIVVAGASGIVGRELVTMLVQAGHQVTGLIRNPDYIPVIKNMGGFPVTVDIFDREAVFEIIRGIQPEVIIHQLTALSARNFVDNANIRKEGTRNLVDAALAVGVRKIIAQSISWAYSPGGEPAKEDEPLDIEAPMPRRKTVEGIQALESKVTEMPEHVILRYGLFYGPDTWYATNGFVAEQVRQGELAASEGISSFVHVNDAARAAHLALDWPSGTFNIVDNEPAPGTEWLPVYADAISAPAPVFQSESGRGERGASNSKALKYGWQPQFTSWRDGFKVGLM
ncbi:nucleoside-diphosphate-sugar epimerase [Paenibacillus anaericanus]|uniref:NAD-dependent epimerase/dehydratase family protein n=1 Tax=Paenibacillus anaericanus TaxID=170367 RepID=UPI002787A646|nr:NAD(P)-dependent oxidoreductase [Paenibacillus anaericanus]MDQ0091430.1 nucleoside-diphosphate-sugar epimerase [Paenibacillus anaericanus]